MAIMEWVTLVNEYIAVRVPKITLLCKSTPTHVFAKGNTHRVQSLTGNRRVQISRKARYSWSKGHTRDQSGLSNHSRAFPRPKTAACERVYIIRKSLSFLLVWIFQKSLFKPSLLELLGTCCLAGRHTDWVCCVLISDYRDGEVCEDGHFWVCIWTGLAQHEPRQPCA